MGTASVTIRAEESTKRAVRAIAEKDARRTRLPSIQTGIA